MTDARDESRRWLSNGPFRKNLPYVAVLLLAVFGVAYSSITQQHLVGYWEFLTVAIGIGCVATQWNNASDGASRRRLIWTKRCTGRLFSLR